MLYERPKELSSLTQQDQWAGPKHSLFVIYLLRSAVCCANRMPWPLSPYAGAVGHVLGGAGHQLAGRIQGCSNACFACVYTVSGRVLLMSGTFSCDLFSFWRRL
jgi:hypothetical protein